MQDVPGAFPPSASRGSFETTGGAEEITPQSLSQAVHARRAEYVRPKHVRIKIGTWNVASYKGTEKDIGGWFVEGEGVTEALAGLTVSDQAQLHRDDIPDQSGLNVREDVASQEARYARKQGTIPKDDPGSLPGNEDVGLYVLGLQEVVDVNSFSEALRPYTDPAPAQKWKDAMQQALPAGYQQVAEQQLIGMLLLIYASPAVVPEIKSASTTSVGTGIGGYMGNKGATTARIVLGETTRLVFINCHLGAGADKTALERRNWDASQILSRTRFEPIKDSMDLSQTTGEQIWDEDIAFWMGDLNYRLEGIPGDDVRRLLMLHTRNEYDLSQTSARKVEQELQTATESVKQRVERMHRESTGSNSSHSYASSDRTSMDTSDTKNTAPTLIDELEASQDPTSLQTTIASLLPHDELQQQIKTRKAFHDGWREGPITFLPTYKYDAGSVGVFDSSEKRRAPSWCDRILYRTRRDKLAYDAKVQEEVEAKKRDEEMKANGLDEADQDDSILYDYDPETDAADDYYDEYDEDAEHGDGKVVITKEGFEDELKLEYYTAHQRVLSSDHKPLNAVFMLKYDAIVPDLKAKVHAEVTRQLDQAENESKPNVAVVVDKHKPDDIETSDDDPANFEGVWFGQARWGQAKHRSLTIANTSRVPATFKLIERPVGPGQSPGIAPKWLNLTVNGLEVKSSSDGSESISLDPGDTANIEIELKVWDVHIARELNEGLKALDDILLLRVEGGRDHFIPVRGVWQESSLGRSINRLIRIPEGGIRRLQHQQPHGDKGKDSASSSTRGTPVGTPLAEQPVRFSAPRELFRLTEAIEELSTRIIAEWDMTAIHEPRGASDYAEKAPWEDHPAWPFEEECWNERTTSQWETALSDACNALDCDESLEHSLPPELPRMQRLYVLCSFLMLFLHSMPDGIVTEELWSIIDAYLADKEKHKRKPSVEEERTAIQEILSQSPSHSISFVLITTMLERLLQEITATRKADEPPTSPGKRPAGTLRRMTGLGRVPAAAPPEQRVPAMARNFAGHIVRCSAPSNEKVKALQEKRRYELVEVFLRRDEP